MTGKYKKNPFHGTDDRGRVPLEPNELIWSVGVLARMLGIHTSVASTAGTPRGPGGPASVPAAC